MPISFKHKVADKTLLIEAEGIDDGIDEVAQYARSILELAYSSDCNKVLCDERKIVYQLSIIDTYTLAETASREAKFLDKIAIVCDPKYAREGGFFETVSQNRGLRLLLSTELAEAQDWLQKES